jgi:hypothetical protein
MRSTVTKKKVNAVSTSASGVPALSEFDERRIEVLSARIRELQPAFRAAIEEEQRVYREIRELQEEVRSIFTRDTHPSLVGFFELSADPFTIIVRTGVSEQTIRIAPTSEQNLHWLKLRGIKMSASDLTSFIADTLAERGLVLEQDPQPARYDVPRDEDAEE